MIKRKFEKSHIHIFESETLSRESRVTESAQKIVSSITYNCEPYTYVYHLSRLITLGRGMFYKNGGRLWRLSDCEELVGVTHRR